MQDGVSIDEVREELIIPNRAPMSVTEIPVLKLYATADSERADCRCWSTSGMMIQSEGVIERNDVDYQIDSVFLNGFKFARV